MAAPQDRACDRSEEDQLKRNRPADDEVDEDEDEVAAEEEVDADLRGGATGGVFSSYVPEGMVRQQRSKKQKQKPKPKKQHPRPGTTLTAVPRYRKSRHAKVGSPTATSRVHI